MTPADTRPEYVITANIGEEATAVCLLADVQGVYRLAAVSHVASTTAGENGILQGLLNAIHRLESTIGLPLLDPQTHLPYQPSGGSVLLACCSSSISLRVLVLGLTRANSIAAVERACRLPFAELAGSFEITLGEQIADGIHWEGLQALSPDVIVLSGGYENAPAILDSTARRLAASYELISKDQRPVVLCAVSQASLRSLVHVLGSSFDMRGVQNPLAAPPGSLPYDLQLELLNIYEQRILPRLPGYDRLASVCSRPPVSALRALAEAAQYLVPALDLVNPAVIHLAPSSSGMISGSHPPQLSGSRCGYAHLTGDASTVLRWLPVDTEDTAAISGYLLGESEIHLGEKGRADAYLAGAHQSLAEMISLRPEYRATTSRVGDSDYIALHTEQLNPADLAANLLAILNAIQPAGATLLELDQYGLWPQLGAAAHYEFAAALEVFDDPLLKATGVCLAPAGSRRSRQALRLEITHSDGTRDHYTIPSGVLRRIALPEDEFLQVSARCGGGWRLGGGERGLQLVTRVGSLGLIIDTRGRPLPIERTGMLWRARVADDLVALTTP